MGDPTERLRTRFERAVEKASEGQTRAFDKIRRRFAERIAKMQRIEHHSPPQTAGVFAAVRQHFEENLKIVEQAQADARTVIEETEKSLLEMLNGIGDAFGQSPPGASAGDEVKDEGAAHAEDEDRAPDDGSGESGRQDA